MPQICLPDFSLAEFPLLFLTLSVHNVTPFFLFLLVTSSVLSLLPLLDYLIMVCLSEVFFSLCLLC